MSFTPSQAQRRFLDRIEREPQASISDLCDGLGMARSTYYRWCREPGFRAWLLDAWSSRVFMDGIGLINQARSQTATSFSHWKAMFNLLFSESGLVAVHLWKSACAEASADAFVHADESDAAPDVPKPSAPVPPEPQPLQQNTAENATLATARPGPAPAAPMPNRVARNIIRAASGTGPAPRSAARDARPICLASPRGQPR